MTIERVFLGWDKPCLQSAAELLLKRYSNSECIDLHKHCVVVPVSRAGRRLIEILVEKAEEEAKRLVPPRILSVGALPELFTEPELPVVSDMQVLLCWMQSFKELSEDNLKALVPTKPDKGAFLKWWSLAKQIQELYVNLSGANLTPEQVLEKCENFSFFTDEVRWGVITELWEYYLQKLNDTGLSDKHQLRRAILEKQGLNYQGDIILLSTSDLNEISKQILAKLESSVFSLVHAPAEKSNLFDQYGCVVSKSWIEEPIDISMDNIAIVSNPTGQAQAVLAALAKYNRQYTPEQVTVGVGDEQLSPYIMQSMQNAALPAREAAGVAVARSSPFLLLSAVSDFITSKSFHAFATLVRHLDVQDWLTRHYVENVDKAGIEIEFLENLDRYHTWHLQACLYGEPIGNSRIPEQVQKIYAAIKELLGSLLEAKRSLCLWAPEIAEFLIRVYGDWKYNRFEEEDRILVEVCDQIHSILSEMQDLNALESLSVGDALYIITSRLNDQYVSAEPKDEAIEILGWLELALDDAPLLIVSGMNEGLIPESVNADPFLPNTLRSALGLLDNDKRYARDVFALNAILHSRAHVHFVAGKRTENNDPLLPSRLLLACQSESLAERVNYFYAAEDDTSKDLTSSTIVGDLSTSERSFQIPPLPQTLSSPLAKISVTAFRDYLNCPYRFYLRHVLGLEELDDHAQEMDAKRFGTLVHTVLADFGKNGPVNSTAEEEIYAFLIDSVEEISKRDFGQFVLPAVFAQLTQIKRRLRSFAKWQAAWISQGWQIKHSEYCVPREVAKLEIDDRSILIEGRIDRIDYNQNTQEWMVFDYKTGDKASNPADSHRRKKDGKWLDLQLPLYHYLLKKDAFREPIKMGYIVLPKDINQTGMLALNWDEEELKEAYEVINAVARDVLDQKFWPPSDEILKFDDFSTLCGQGQFLGAYS